MKNSKIQLLLLISAITLSCWNNQDHDVNRPESPFYNMTATLQDWVSAGPLPNYDVEIVATDLIYDVTFDTFRAQSDSSGMLTVNPIYPGRYVVFVYYEGIEYGSFHLVVGHEDLERTYKIPEKLGVYRIKTDLQNFYSSAIAIDSNRAWIFSQKIVTLETKNYGWIETGSYNNPLKDMNITAADMYDTLVYVCQSPDTVVEMDRRTGAISARYFHDDVNLMGLTCDRETGQLYGCTLTKLLVFSNDKTHIDATVPVNASNLRALAYHQDLYAFDVAESVCYRFDADFNLTGVYILIDVDDQTRYDLVSDMDFDNGGRLWIVPVQ